MKELNELVNELNIDEVDKEFDEFFNEYFNSDGTLKDEAVADCLGYHDKIEIRQNAAGIFDRICEDKLDIEKNIIYNLANIELSAKGYRDLQEKRLNNPDENDEDGDEMACKLISIAITEFQKELSSCRDELEIANKAISIVARYIDAY